MILFSRYTKYFTPNSVLRMGDSVGILDHVPREINRTPFLNLPLSK